MRCLFAAAIVQPSDLLILDEPMDFPDLFGTFWLQKFLQGLRENSPLTIVLVVSHDRDFINASTNGDDDPTRQAAEILRWKHCVVR